MDSDLEAPGRSRALRGRMRKTSEVVAQDLLLDIIEQGFQPGQQLPNEGEMIAKYGVARSTVREALRILEINGLISMRPGPGGGPTVRRAGAEDFGRVASLFLQSERMTVQEVLEARRHLEPSLVRDATLKREPAFLRRAEDLQKRGRQVDIRNSEQYLSLAREFHQVMASASGSRVLNFFNRGLMSMFVGKLDNGVFPMEQRQLALDEHDRVLTAILAGDADAAERLMRCHMDHFLEGIAQRQSSAYGAVIRWE